ncbi:hypothetical protein [uncultured Desulfuromonas sp.]|nr:hypothetical protein [uncultured Desulfuromonas sp.]
MEEGQLLFLPPTKQTKTGPFSWGKKSNSLHDDFTIKSDKGRDEK